MVKRRPGQRANKHEKLFFLSAIIAAVMDINVWGT